MKEAGWHESRYETEKRSDERKFSEQCIECLDVLLAHENSWPFRKPVDRVKVRDYYDVIEHPMDLESVRMKVDKYAVLHEG